MTAETEVHEDKVVAAMERSLSWLSSYPGGLSDRCYEQMRAAIPLAERDARLQPLYEALVDCARAISRTNPTSSFRALRNVLRSIEEANHD
jgi:hypothetical protein